MNENNGLGILQAGNNVSKKPSSCLKQCAQVFRKQGLLSMPFLVLKSGLADAW